MKQAKLVCKMGIVQTYERISVLTEEKKPHASQTMLYDQGTNF